jgi:multidrug efflux pump subunit AcrA (membrane-fusion protein)
VQTETDAVARVALADVDAAQAERDEAITAASAAVAAQAAAETDRDTAAAAADEAIAAMEAAQAGWDTAQETDVWTRVSSQIGYLMTPFHTLLGIAIGYYFGSKFDKRD